MSLCAAPERVFHIDIETSEPCGGVFKIIASIEDPAVINDPPPRGEDLANTGHTPLATGRTRPATGHLPH